MTLIYSRLLYWDQSFIGQSPSSASDSDSGTKRPHQQAASRLGAPTPHIQLPPSTTAALGLPWQAFLDSTGCTPSLRGTAPHPWNSIFALRFPKSTSSTLWAKLLVTFFSILEPFNKLFHLLQKNTFSFCKMRVFIPLQDGFLTQNFSCKMCKSSINTGNH